MKTKMNFSDIANVIERDEMRGIVGGYRSAERPQDMAYEFSAGAAGGESKLPSFAPGRGGMYGLGVGNTYSSMTTKFGCETNSYYSILTSNSYYTNDPREIAQIMSGLTTNNYNYNSNYDYQKSPKTDCFFQCLGWISAMYGDTVHDAKYYEKNYSQIFGTSSNGVSEKNALDFTGKYFNTVNLNENVKNNLANWVNPKTNPNGDHHLIGTYEVPGGGLHAVVITSIIGNTVNYYDPQNNVASSKNISNMTGFYGINGGCN